MHRVCTFFVVVATLSFGEIRTTHSKTLKLYTQCIYLYIVVSPHCGGVATLKIIYAQEARRTASLPVSLAPSSSLGLSLRTRTSKLG